MSFNFDSYSKQLKASSTLNESAVAVDAVPEKTVIYQMIRRAVMPKVLAECRLKTDQGVVFGKFRKIGGVNALEYTKDGAVVASLARDFDYGVDSEFQYAQSVYVVKGPFRVESDVSDFDLTVRLQQEVQRGVLEFKQVEGSFGISKLVTAASSRRTRLSATQELLQDIDSVYGEGMAQALIRDCLVSSASEIINKDAIDFIWKTCAKTDNFIVKEYDYGTARALVQKIHQAANKVTDATGNKCTYVLAHPDVIAFIEQSGLVDDGFIGGLELVSSNFFTTARSVVVGFRRDVEDGDFEEKPEFMMGSYIWMPYINELVSAVDTQSMTDNIGVVTRYSISVAPYKEEKTFVRGDDVNKHLDANVNAFGFQLEDYVPPAPEPEPPVEPDPVP